MAQRKKSNAKGPTAILDKESARKAGLRVAIRRRDGSVVDALSDGAEPTAQTASQSSVDKAFSRLAELVDHEDPVIALKACELFLRHAPSASKDVETADRVYGCNRFDRAGTGEDSTFRAELDPEDERTLAKVLQRK